MNCQIPEHAMLPEHYGGYFCITCELRVCRAGRDIHSNLGHEVVLVDEDFPVVLRSYEQAIDLFLVQHQLHGVEAWIDPLLAQDVLAVEPEHDEEIPAHLLEQGQDEHEHSHQLQRRKIEKGLPLQLEPPIFPEGVEVGPDWKCAICQQRDNPDLDDVDQTSQQINAVAVIPCGHSFHFECIQHSYLVSSEKCPNCRQDITDISGVPLYTDMFEGKSRKGKSRKSRKDKSCKSSKSRKGKSRSN